MPTQDSVLLKTEISNIPSRTIHQDHSDRMRRGGRRLVLRGWGCRDHGYRGWDGGSRQFNHSRTSLLDPLHHRNLPIVSGFASNSGGGKVSWYSRPWVAVKELWKLRDWGREEWGQLQQAQEAARMARAQLSLELMKQKKKDSDAFNAALRMITQQPSAANADSPEGLRAAFDKMDATIKDNPLLKEYMQHLSQGKSPAEFEDTLKKNADEHKQAQLKKSKEAVKRLFKPQDLSFGVMDRISAARLQREDDDSNKRKKD